MADINLRAQPLNIFGTVGDDLSIVLTVVDSAGDPIDVSGYTISAKVWRGATEVDEFTDAVSGASNNVITLSLTDTETTAIGTERGLRWSLSMTTGGITEQWVGGKFELLNAGHPKASGVSAATLTYTSGDVTVTLGSISTTALDGRYAPLGIAGPGRVSGRYFRAALGAVSGSAFGLTNNTEFAVPFYAPAAATVDRIAVNVTLAGASGSVLRLGIKEDSGGIPGDIVVDAGTVASETTGVKEITISQALTAGWYWLIVVGQGGPASAPQVTNCDAAYTIGHPTASTAFSSTLAAPSRTGVSGALSSGGAWSGINTRGPLIQLRYA